MAIIGIDLGTTNSLVSVWTEDGVKLIPNSFGEYLTPSVVSFDEKGTVYVGKIAKEMLVTNPGSSFKEFKRHMGTEKKYKIEGSLGKEYTPEELSAYVLRQLKEDAQKYLNEPVEEVIISVPAYFNDNQRCATRDAGKIAGLKVERLINEPSAAALTYHVQNEEEHHVYMIFDLGGGTLDVSVVEAFGNIIEIQSVAGDNHLGGKDFNNIITNYFFEQHGLNKTDFSEKAIAHIYQEAEKCKIQLTDEDEVAHKIFFEGKEYELQLTNQKLIEVSGVIFRRITEVIEKALNNCNLTITDIDDVILAGGSTKMPIIRYYLEKIFNKKVVCKMNPDESIAMGIGILTGIKLRNENIKDVILSDICPFSMGTQLYDGSFFPIIERNEILPCSRSHIFTTVHDYQDVIDASVYQGESLVAEENLLIANLEIEVPKLPAGQVHLEMKYTYDINGILEIDLKCMENGNELHKSIVNKNLGLSEEELKIKKEELQKLKIHPRDKDENRLLLLKAQHLYEELGSEQRRYLLEAYNVFVHALNSQKENLIRSSYLRFTLQLEMLKNSRGVNLQYDDDFWNNVDSDLDTEDER